MTEDKTTYTIQGGIHAANGMNAVFMGRSVMAVSRSSGTNGERRGGNEAKDRERKGNGLFAQYLDVATQEIQGYRY